MSSSCIYKYNPAYGESRERSKSNASKMKETEEGRDSLNFIETIIEEDLRNGKNEKRVHTRFPPEPNGYLHIGHAKSICLNFGLASKYSGICNLRFDDTNPSKEEVEYVDSIKEDVRWLGFDWEDREYYASDYFNKLYDFAVKLINLGLAYVDDQPAETIAGQKGSPTQPGTESPFRTRTKEENLDLFERMKAGEFEDGTRVLRAKIDMASPNMHMQVTNGASTQCMILHMDSQIISKELLIRSAPLSLRFIGHFTIGLPSILLKALIDLDKLSLRVLT